MRLRSCSSWGMASTLSTAGRSATAREHPNAPRLMQVNLRDDESSRIDPGFTRAGLFVGIGTPTHLTTPRNRRTSRRTREARGEGTDGKVAS